ncbi:MAG TPA: chaperone modulator CbpM [Myxococcota bacterium]
MTTYTLRQICELLDLDEGFAAELVREAVLVADAPEAERYSERMLERARVARELVQELEVNLAGAAVIVRLREELVDLRRIACALARELERARAG